MGNPITSDVTPGRIVDLAVDAGTIAVGTAAKNRWIRDIVQELVLRKEFRDVCVVSECAHSRDILNIHYLWDLDVDGLVCTQRNQYYTRYSHGESTTTIHTVCTGDGLRGISAQVVIFAVNSGECNTAGLLDHATSIIVHGNSLVNPEEALVRSERALV